MSDFSSPLPAEENSQCESSENELNKLKEKSKQSKKTRTRSQRRSAEEIKSSYSDDGTESQLNFEEMPATSTAYSSPVARANHEKMRRKLQFHFMNPIEKWQAKRRYVYDVICT